MTKMSSGQQARREKILDAGQMVILNLGLRAATMEGIAAEAGVAKPTLYKYFPDKAAIYDALIERSVAALKDVFDAALAHDGSVVDRVAGALIAKKKFVFRLLQSSPHAAELCGDDIEPHLDALRALERYVEDEVCSVLTPRTGDNARYMAQLLMACTNGIGKQAQYAEQIGPAVRLVVTKMLA